MELSQASPPWSNSSKPISQWYWDQLGHTRIQNYAQCNWAPLPHDFAARIGTIMAENSQHITTTSCAPSHIYTAALSTTSDPPATAITGQPGDSAAFRWHTCPASCQQQTLVGASRAEEGDPAVGSI